MSNERLAELDSAYGEGGTKATAATKRELRAVILELLDDARRQRRGERQARAELAELREQIGRPADVYAPGDEHGPFTNTPHTEVAARAAITDGQKVWRRFVGEWKPAEQQHEDGDRG